MTSPPDSREDETEQHLGPVEPTAMRVAVFWDGGSTVKVVPTKGSLSFGRAVECDVAIDHKSVSRRHAILHVGQRLEVEDLGSANGTRVRGRALGTGERMEVGPGDVIELGSTMAVLQGGGREGGRNLSMEPSDADLAREGRHAGGGRYAGDEGAFPLVIESPAMVQLFRLVGLVAPTPVSVIIRGETGVGKDVLATAIHRRSPRAKHPFVCLNCAAVPEALLESELFGHERGAFTGAERAKPGLLEGANGGTVFLDEIGEMAPATQAKLLRAVETRQVTRLGSLKPLSVDVRFVAATHRDLEALVREGTFRQDLYFRLNGVSLYVPPLRERRDEIVPLAELFVREAAAATGNDRERRSVPTLAEATKEVLRRHTWPGNVRELKNAIAQAMIFRDGAPVLTPEHLPPVPNVGGASARATAEPAAAPHASDTGLRRELSQFERERIVAALEQCSGNQTRAAALLGISRRTLLSRLDAYGLPRPRK